MTFYTKYRPQTWDKVAGQMHITRTLMNALKNDNVAHALLFAGKHGTGKTTVARILAKGLGAVGSDLVEIDAASNRGIDDARRLKESTFFVPVNGPVKVFILDEAHMLTKEANNALLKTLEEPPPGVYFILCTTVPDKLLMTIRSRCQRHQFKQIAPDVIVQRLEHICNKEDIGFENDALNLTATQARGSMRDGISLLELISNFGYVSLKRTREVLGLGEDYLVRSMVDNLAEESVKGCLDVVAETWGSGADLSEYCRQVVNYFRGLLLTEYGTPDPTLIIDKADVGRFTLIGLQYSIRIWNQARLKVHKCTIPSLELECAAIDCIDYGVSAGAGDF